MLKRNFVERNRDMAETVNRILRQILTVNKIYKTVLYDFFYIVENV